MRSPGRAARPQIAINEPVAGYYKRKLVSKGPWVPVRLFYGPPVDPETGDELDRSWRWQACIGDEIKAGDAEIADVWVASCRSPITEAEWRFLVADRQWATEHAPHLPEANPYRRIDLASLPVLF